MITIYEKIIAKNIIYDIIIVNVVIGSDNMRKRKLAVTIYKRVKTKEYGIINNYSLINDLKIYSYNYTITI